MNQSLYDYCIQNGRQDLLETWDEEKNLPLTPQMVTAMTGKKAWWSGPCGHSWQRVIGDQVRKGGGCPYCSSQKLLPGFNDLATRNPGLAAQWNAEKNGDLTPQQVMPHSNKKTWWRCEKGHEWMAAISSRSNGYSCPYCNNRRTLPGYNDLATRDPELAAQWDYDANAPLTPNQVMPHTDKSVFWICQKGHHWKAPISRRSTGKGCPICANMKIIPGLNDFATLRPDLMKEWDYAKNGDVSPQQLSEKTDKKVWWCCKLGHEWQASLKFRARGKVGCPICANNAILTGFNDLATTYPNLAAQWDQKKNGDLTPQQVTSGSDKEVWWICEKGHEWKVSVMNRTRRGDGCPYCSNRKVLAGFNDLATIAPGVAAQWHPSRNGSLMPQDVVAGSGRIVWWQCPLGHEWESAISKRVLRQDKCPYCVNRRVWPGFNDLATLEPEIAAQWHPALNGSLTAHTVLAGSNRYAWWICHEGHVWRTIISNRTSPRSRSGCPVCAGNIDEKRLAYYQKLMDETYSQLGIDRGKVDP